MRRTRVVVSVLAASAIAVAGCSAVGRTTQPGEVAGAGEAACPDDRFLNGTRVLSCAEAVRAAEKELGWLHLPVASATFTRGVGTCPRMPERLGESSFIGGLPGAMGDRGPDLRCTRIGRNATGVVVFTFAFGEPVRMYVALDERGIAVASTQALEPGSDVPALEPGMDGPPDPGLGAPN